MGSVAVRDLRRRRLFWQVRLTTTHVVVKLDIVGIPLNWWLAKIVLSIKMTRQSLGKWETTESAPPAINARDT